MHYPQSLGRVLQATETSQLSHGVYASRSRQSSRGSWNTRSCSKKDLGKTWTKVIGGGWQELGRGHLDMESNVGTVLKTLGFNEMTLAEKLIAGHGPRD